MPRKKKPSQPQTYAEYAGFSSRQMRLRAIEAGCRTIAEKSDWVDEHYGNCSAREQYNFRAPGPFRPR